MRRVFNAAHNALAARLHAFIIIPAAAAQLTVHLLLLTQVTGDDTTVIEAVLACDTERTQLLKEEQTLLKQLNKEAPDQTHAATTRPPPTVQQLRPTAAAPQLRSLAPQLQMPGTATALAVVMLLWMARQLWARLLTLLNLKRLLSLQRYSQ